MEGELPNHGSLLSISARFPSFSTTLCRSKRWRDLLYLLQDLTPRSASNCFYVARSVCQEVPGSARNTSVSHLATPRSVSTTFFLVSYVYCRLSEISAYETGCVPPMGVVSSWLQPLRVEYATPRRCHGEVRSAWHSKKTGEPLLTKSTRRDNNRSIKDSRTRLGGCSSTHLLNTVSIHVDPTRARTSGGVLQSKSRELLGFSVSIPSPIAMRGQSLNSVPE